MYLDEEKRRSESPRNGETVPDQEMDDDRKFGDTRLLKIDESFFLHLHSYTRIIVCNTGFFHQETEEEAMRKLRADERKRAQDAEKAKAISTTREPANRVGTLQSQNQSAPNRRVEKGTISP